MGPLRALSFERLLNLKMSDPTWGWNVEMQMKAAAHRYRITEVPIRYAARLHGKSKISGSVIGSIRAGAKILACCFSFLPAVWRIRRLHTHHASHSRQKRCSF